MRSTGTVPLSMRGWPAALTSLGLFLTFAIPGPLLDLVGFGYSSPSGGALEKIHPGTELIILAFSGAVVRTGRPVEALRSVLDRFPGVAAFLATIAFLAVYIIKVQHAPFTLLVDTFLVPALLFVLLVDIDVVWLRHIERGLHAFVIFNATLGIVEFLSGWHLVPVASAATAGPSAPVDWRAAALLGHPLASAAMAGLYAIVLALGGGRELPSAWRGAVQLLQIVALTAFGGRTALVCTLLFLAGTSVIGLAGILAGRTMPRRTVGLLLLGAPLLAVLAAGLVQSGFFDQLLLRFADDNGSAQARATIFNLFGYLSWPDLLFGPDLDRMISLQHLEGIEVGVESFWFGFIFNYGLLASLVFFAGLACFFAHLMARVSAAAWAPLLYFVVIISTSISLSAKSTSLTQFMAVLYVMMPSHSERRVALTPARSVAA